MGCSDRFGEESYPHFSFGENNNEKKHYQILTNFYTNITEYDQIS
jgi:hypothetical protein